MLQREAKSTVKYLVDALEPQEFKNRIKKKLELAQFKDYKSNVCQFYCWVTEMLRQHIEWSTTHNRAPKPDRNNGDRPKPKATPVKKPNDNGNGSGGKLTKFPCLKCGSYDHRVKQCPNVVAGEADQLIESFRKRKQYSQDVRMNRIDAPVNSAVAPEKGVDIGNNREDHGMVQAEVDGILVKSTLLDTGADVSLVSNGVLDALKASGAFVCVADATPLQLVPVGQAKLTVDRKALFRTVKMHSSAGPVLLRDLECWIDESDASMTLTIGRQVMVKLGYSTDNVLVDALKKQEEWSMYDVGNNISGLNMKRVQHAIMNMESACDCPEDWKVASPELENTPTQKVVDILEERIRDAEAQGIGIKGATRLRSLLTEYVDVFRVEFGRDPPVKVPPMQVRLKKGAVPVKAKVRRYPPLHQTYMEEHVNALVNAGLVFENHRSRWASPPRIVSKKEPGEYRMTVDTRAVNACTEPMPWPMPHLDTALTQLEGSEVYFNLDWFRGYWQLPLHEDSQEIFSFVTHRGVFTPKRVPMGATDAVAYCQGVVETIFGELLYKDILAWLDDIVTG